MIAPYKYDSEIHNGNYHLICPHLEENTMGFQNHQKESQIHFNFYEPSIFLLISPEEWSRCQDFGNCCKILILKVLFISVISEVLFHKMPIVLNVTYFVYF